MKSRYVRVSPSTVRAFIIELGMQRGPRRSGLTEVRTRDGSPRGITHFTSITTPDWATTPRFIERTPGIDQGARC